MLHRVLPDLYFSHYVQFVAAVHLLSSHSITSEDVDEAEKYLDSFYSSSVMLYGSFNC